MGFLVFLIVVVFSAIIATCALLALGFVWAIFDLLVDQVFRKVSP